tara:strand:- start:49 stop:1683 length:1635 start_codon:yes stop_codon:yes gene_type:complete
MFRDLKEYQEIHNLYQNSVYLSEDERKFIETVNETEFTDEELLYFSENTEEVINHLIESEILNEGAGIFRLGGLVKGLKNVKSLKNVKQLKNIKLPSKNVKNIKLPSKGYELQSIGGFKGFKDSPLTGITNKLKDKLNLKGLLKGKKDKIAKSVKPTKSKVKGVKPKGKGISAGVAGAIGGGAVLGASELMNQSSKRATEAELAAIKKQLEKLQKERDDRIDKDVEKYVKDRKNPEGINKDLTIDKSKEKKTEVKPETKTEVKPETKTETKPTNPSGKVIPKPKKPLSDKSPAAKAGISKERRQKFANQNAAFQATKRKDSGYTKMDFIKDFPNSQTAKKYRKGESIPGFRYKKNLKSSYEYDTHKGLNEKIGLEALIPKDSFSEKPKPKPKEKPVRKPSDLGPASLIPPESFKGGGMAKEELEELTPYDIVLEYLLYTEQVATIEEANYVMTEMDGKTINDIVKEVTQSLEEGLGSVRVLPALGKMALGAAAVKGISSYLGKKSGEASIKGGQQVKDKAGAGGGLIKKIKDRTDATNKAIEKM